MIRAAVIWSATRKRVECCGVVIGPVYLRQRRDWKA